MQHAQNMGPLLFAHNENIAHVMPRVTACAVTSCADLHAGKPAALLYVACQELLMDVPFTQAELHLSKITTSHFNTLNTKMANQNVLERILIAMLNENQADSNENFKICSEEPVAPLYKR